MALSFESYQWKYDVFLSFRGEDTRKNFTSHLYQALSQKGVNTFIDYKELKRGEKISFALFDAIEVSRISVVILSKTYASSTYCLDELLKILECKDSKGQLVLPVFYHINPSQVKHQKGGFEEALARHEDKFRDDEDKVKRWRAALCEVATLSGWHIEDGLESMFVKRYSGTNNIEGIRLDLPEPNKVEINGKALATMKRLRLLMINNAHISDDIQYLSDELRLIDWPGYPSSTLPQNFHPKRLVSLNLSHGRIQDLWKIFRYLKLATFTCCEYLTEIPDFSMIPNLESLCLDHCKRLTKVHESVGYLDKLATLNFPLCSNLKDLPSCFKLKSLNTLVLTGCSKVRKFPEIVERMVYLEELLLQGTAIKELPQSIEYLNGLKVLLLDSCQKLEHLPNSIHNLSCLTALGLTDCHKLKEVPKLPPNIRYIDTGNCRSLESLSVLSNSSNLSAANLPMFSEMVFVNCNKLINKHLQDLVTNLLYNEVDANCLSLFGYKESVHEVMLPGSNIPDWFDHQSTNSSISLMVSSRLYGKQVELFFVAVLELEKGAITTVVNYWNWLSPSNLSFVDQRPKLQVFLNVSGSHKQVDKPRFVSAFCQSNCGDVSPNVLGTFCIDRGLPVASIIVHAGERMNYAIAEDLMKRLKGRFDHVAFVVVKICRATTGFALEQYMDQDHLI
ncbi:hypothetical protein Fmac_015965 [Flemingia macrophylla]|uniref:TIR domain-containing protein n=1 Tax=Flemingia macrophylla TaxID=520843 RepID=A0ABD1MG18_9FABA